jgi:hypothetical protein
MAVQCPRVMGIDVAHATTDWQRGSLMRMAAFGPLRTLLVYSEIMTTRIPTAWCRGSGRRRIRLRGCPSGLRPPSFMPLHRTHRRPDPATWLECGGQVLFCNIAMQDLTPSPDRTCPNEAPAGRVVSCAMRPCREHRRAVCASSARPPHHEPPPGPACRDARRRQHRPRGQTTSATGRKQTGPILGYSPPTLRSRRPRPGMLA